MEPHTNTDPFQINWNNYASIYSKSFSELRKISKYEDVTLVVDDGYALAHRLVLATCSPILASIMDLSPKPGVVYLGDINNKIVNLLLDFMYTGVAEIAKEDLDEFLKVGDKLKVVGLSENEFENKINESEHETTEEDKIKDILHSPKTKRGLSTKKKRRSESFINNDDNEKESNKKQRSSHEDFDDILDITNDNIAKISDDEDVIPIETTNHREDIIPIEIDTIQKQIKSSPSTDPDKIKEILNEISVMSSDKTNGDKPSFDREDIVNCLIAAINSGPTIESNGDGIVDVIDIDPKQDDQDDEDIVEVGLVNKAIHDNEDQNISDVNPMDYVEITQNEESNKSIDEALDEIYNNTVDEIVLDGTPDFANNGKMILTKSKEDRRKWKKEFEVFIKSKTQVQNNKVHTSWRCSVCDKQFINEKFAESHVDSKHTDHILHKCVECGLIVDTDMKLTFHINSSHDS